MIETFVDEYGEQRYRIPLTADHWRATVLPLLAMERPPNLHAIEEITRAVAEAPDGDGLVTVTLASMEAMAVSRVLGD